jgi:ribose transport system permease protein
MSDLTRAATPGSASPPLDEGDAPSGRFAGLTGQNSGFALRDYGILICFAALFITLSVSSDAFLTSSNLLNLLDQATPTGIIACAATLVIIAGGFDLSVGAIYAIAGVIAAKVALDSSAVMGLLAGVAVGVGFGIVNGILVTKGLVHSFIATLAMALIIRGAASAITDGNLITVTNPAFATLGTDEFLGVKYSIWIFVVFAASTWFVLARTTFGRYVYAVGGNAMAASLSGIRVSLVKATTFAISGLAAGIAGVIIASRNITGQSDSGVGLELSVIAAVVIGGTSILGGSGAVWRTVIGVLLLAMIGNGFNLLNVDPTYQQMVQGGIILLAVVVDARARRSAE